MKNNFNRKLLAIILSLALLMNSGAAAFAAEGGINGVATSITADCSCPIVDSGIVHGNSCTLNEEKPAQGEKPAQSDCICPPVDSGEVTHGTNCPLYEKLVPEQADAVKNVLALIGALPTMDELAAQDTEGAGFADYLAKLRLDTAAARAAYNALTAEQKAELDPAVLAKLTELESILAAMPVLMNGVIPTLSADANNSYQNVKYTLNTGTPNTATVSGVVSKTAATGVDNVLTIPAQVQKDSTTYNVTAIGNDAFYDCANLTAVTIPASVTTIGTSAFRSCTSLSEITIPASVTTIGGYAFELMNGAVITLKHTGNIPNGFDLNAFRSSTATDVSPLYLLISDEAFAEQFAESVPYNVNHAMIVKEVPTTRSFNNKNDKNTLMADSSNRKFDGKYDVYGIDKKGTSIPTTYQGDYAGAFGYNAYLSTEVFPQITNSYRLRLPGSGVYSAVKSGIWASANTEFVSDGEYLRVTYTIRNSTDTAITNVSLGVNADVQIGDDDTATVLPTPTGFRMVNTLNTGVGIGMQFTLNCINAPGADNVDTVWYGRETSKNTSLYTDLVEKNELTDTDSGLAFSWQGMTIPANGEITRSVVFGVGEAAAPPALPTDGSKPIALYLTTTGQKDITVNAKVTDTTGVTDTLYYTINGGTEQTLGETVTAETGVEKTIAGVIGASNFTDNGTYTVKLWIMNSKGAMSEVITKVLTVAADGAMSGAGLETGAAPVAPGGGGTPPAAECSCTLSTPTFVTSNIAIPADQASTTYALQASGSTLGGSCAVAGHNITTIAYSFAEKTDDSNIASITGTTLTVTGAGSVVVTATAAANGKTATKDATFTVTKAAAADKITIKINDVATEHGGATLQAAVDTAKGAGAAYSTITKLTITKGEVTAADWTWFKGGGTPVLSKLTYFTVESAVTTVADIPDLSSGKTFPPSIINVTIPQAIKIGNRAFYFCTALKTVNIPNATSIGGHAFRSCTALTTATFPKAISIGQEAFYECKALPSANFPEAISIGSNAFYGCIKLQTASFSKATSMESRAFYGCIRLESASFPKATSIGKSAFNYCDALTTASFPEATSIGQEAFYSCKALETATFPVVATIGQEAFYGCKALATLKLPATPPTVANVNAFTNCLNIRNVVPVNASGNALTESTTPKLSVVAAEYDKVVSPDTGTATDGLWFGWKVREPVVESKITIKVNDNTTEYGGDTLQAAVDTAKGAGAAYSTVTKLTVTKGEVTAADWEWFRGSRTPVLTKLTDFTVAAVTKVANIPDTTSARTFPTSIVSVNIPQVIKIGARAFYECDALTTASFPAVTSIGDSSFYNCYALTTASFPAATSIGKSAFSDCKALTTATFTAVRSIGGYAFLRCKALKTASFPAAESIGDHAFSSCDALTTATFTVATSIGESAFFACKMLETASFPAATSIGDSSFYNCYALTTASFPVATSIGKSAFTWCTALTNVSFPAVTSIGEYAFENCKKLAGASFPVATSIEKGAFNACSLLTSTSFPKVTTIGEYALDSCKALTSASFPAATSIEKGAFRYCTALATLKLGATPPTVADTNAFSQCLKTTLTLVDTDGNALTGTALTTAQATYDAVTTGGGTATDGKWYGWKVREPVAESKITIKINNGAEVSGASLQAAVGSTTLSTITNLTITKGEVTAADWTWLKSLTALTSFTIVDNAAVTAVAAIPDLTSNRTFPVTIETVTIPQPIAIGNHAFNGCSVLETAKISKATSIGDNAFAFCAALTTANFPAAISIGDYAFFECSALITVDIPKATSIGGNAFAFCKTLATASFPAAESIGKQAFMRCTILQSISFPAAISIGKSAFSNCTSLATLKLGATVPTTVGEDAFTNCPTDRSLKFVGTDGITELTGNDLTTAQAAYTAAADGTTTDDLWYGWKIGGGAVTVPVTGVTLNKTTLSLAAGKSETLTATVAPANATNKAVTWQTSNAAVATVTDGLVTAVKEGSATITVTTTDGGKTATCAVTVTAATSKPAAGGKLEAPLTQEKVDGVFGEGNATLDGTTTPPTIKLEKDITPEKPIEIETDVKIDLGGNTITGKPGETPIIVGDRDKVTIDGSGTIAGGDSTTGTGGNGITGGTGSDITIGKDVTVEGGNGTTGGDGINSGGTVTDNGKTEGGNGSAGNGGDGVDTSGGSGNVVIGGGGTASGGDSTGGNGNGGNGTSSGGNTTVGGDVTGGNGNGIGSGGNGATDTSGGNGNIIINGGGSAQGGNGGNSGGAGGDGAQNNGGGNTTVGGDANGGNGGSNSSGTGGAGGNGSTSTDSGGSTITGGGSSTGGNGGSGATGGNGGDGADSGTIDIGNGGTANGGNGGTGTGTGGNGGDGSSSSGKGDIDGTANGGNGGAGGSTGGNGGNGAASGSGSNAGDINIGGKTEGGDGGTGGTTGGAGGNGTTTGGDINVGGGGSSTGGNGGSSSTGGGNGGNGTNTNGSSTVINGGATGGDGGNGNGNGAGGNGGNGASQGSGTVGGGGTATGGNGGNGAGTGNGGTGGAGVGGGASAGGGLTTTGGANGLKATTTVDDTKSGTTVTVPDKSTLANAALTADEKKDKDITEISVTLSIEKKNNQPDKVAVDKVLSSENANTIGAFFDITLDKIITKAGGAQPSTKVTNASEEIKITITIPTNMRGGSNYVVIRVHNGVGAALATAQAGNDLTFSTDKFSTYAIAYTPSGTTPTPPPTNNTSGGSSGGGTGNEEAFWKNTSETIGDAKKDDVIKVNAGNYDRLPAEIIDTIRKNNITLIIEWNNGETITIPAGKAPNAEAGRVFYPLSLLAELYKNVKFVDTATAIKPQQGANPETGGTGYIEYADGKTSVVSGKVVQAENAINANSASGTGSEGASNSAVAKKAVTPPTAGFVGDEYVGESTAANADTATPANSGNAFAVIAAMLAAVAVGSGVWFWKRRTQTEKQ